MMLEVLTITMCITMCIEIIVLLIGLDLLYGTGQVLVEDYKKKVRTSGIGRRRKK